MTTPSTTEPSPKAESLLPVASSPSTNVAAAVDAAITEEETFLKERHIAYFAQVLDPTKALPIGYSKLDTNRLTLVHFAVHALDLLGVWESDDLQRRFNISKSSIKQWIYSLQLTSSSTSGTTCDGGGGGGEGAGFQGGPYVGSCGNRNLGGNEGNNGEETVESATPITCTEYHQSHIAMTYTALCTLQALHLSDGYDNMFWEEEEKNCGSRRLDIHGILSTLTKLQRSDGSFQCTIVPSESDMRFLYCACAICYMLNDFSTIDIELALSYIKSCRSYDGSIALIPGQEGHGGSTFCAIAALQLLHRLDVLEVVDGTTCWKDQLLQWCVHRQIGGMQGRPNKAEDTCYSYWIGGTLYILGYSHLLDNTALRMFILRCQHPKLGGFSKVVGSYPDVLHSFYSLAWLSLSNNRNDNDDNAGKYCSNGIGDRDNKTQRQHLPINKLNCTLGIRQKCAVLLFDSGVGLPLP